MTEPEDRESNDDGRTYTIRIGGTSFCVPKEYTIQQMVGQGTYGTVCSATYEPTSEQVAVKKIEHAFEHIAFTRRALRELRILRNLRHENIVSILSVFLHGDKETFMEIYVVSELMETDLTSIVNSNQSLTDDHYQFFIYQILRGLKYIHSAEVIHRDLKPRNMLVNANCDLKICDFGLAHIRLGSDVEVAPATQYVCTRWYRAPEVLCSWTCYNEGIDVWSVACIFAEMINKAPLFPGMSTQHQLQLLTQIMGSQPDAAAKMPNEKCQSFLKSLPHTEPRRLDEVLPGASPEAIQLLGMMLVFDPDERCSVEMALQSKFLESLHNPEDEPTRGPLDGAGFEFERGNIDDTVLREEIYKEMLQYHSE